MVYYFGPRGLEFDLEFQPGEDWRSVTMEVPGVVLSVDASGGLLADGKPLSAAPVAYRIDRAGTRTPVPSAYRLIGAHRAGFEVGAVPADEKLVIDPVLTYATYFMGEGITRLLLAKEMPDGSLLLAGNTNGTAGGAIDAVTGRPVSPWTGTGLRPLDCFVARLRPKERKVMFVSYLGGPGIEECTGAAVDGAGRVLLTGVAFDVEGFPTTADAEVRVSTVRNSPFLARIAATGDKLEYSTFLNLPGRVTLLAPGASDTVHLATFYGGTGEENVDGLVAGPDGNLYLYGRTHSRDLPLIRPVQVLAAGFRSAAFLAAITPNYQELPFATYLGGRLGGIETSSLHFTPDNALRISGTAAPAEIPDFPFDSPAGVPQAFSLEMRPGEVSFENRYHSRNNQRTASLGAFYASDGRYCLMWTSGELQTHPASAVLTPHLPAGERVAGCFFDGTTILQTVTEIGGLPVATSKDGGFWTQVTVPFESLNEAIQPELGSLGLGYIDLQPKAPVMITPGPIRLPGGIPISGRNFTRRFWLEVSGHLLNVRGLTSTTASIEAAPGHAVPPGVYSGRLVSSESPDLVSGSFEVISQYLAPAQEPGVPVPGRAPRVRIKSPVYPSTEVFWQGRPVPHASYAAERGGMIEVDLPPEDGELTVRNPSPGGGVVRQRLSLSPSQSRTPSLLEPAVITWQPPPVGGALSGSFRLFVAPGNVLTGECHAIWDGAIRSATCAGETVTLGLSQVDVNRFGKHSIQIVAPAWRTPVQSVWVGTTASANGFDPSRSVYYWAGAQGVVAVDYLSGRQTVTAGDMTDTLTVTRDGRYLYALTRSGTARRFLIDGTSLTSDLEFPIPGTPPAGTVTLHSVEGDSESLVITTADRILHFHRGELRPRMGTLGRSQTLRQANVLVATPWYVYARNSESSPVTRCLARFPVDEEGLGPPSEYCPPGAVWGVHEEQRRASAGPMIVAGGRAILVGEWSHPGAGLDPQAHIPDLAADLVVRPVMFADPIGVTQSFRIDFARLSDGRALGHYPRGWQVRAAPVMFLQKDTLVVGVQPLTERFVSPTLVPVRWREEFEEYE